MKQKNSRIPKNRKIVIATLVLVLLVGGATTIYYVRHSLSKRNQPPISDKINTSPPTKEEQDAGDKQKQKNIQQNAAVKPSNATILISDASQYDDTVEVRAYVSNVAESGGTCTTTITQNNNQVVEKTTAFGDAKTTQCGAIDIARSRFASAGSWSVVVNYASENISGQSAASNLIIK